jgi:hypothetical protein
MAKKTDKPEQPPASTSEPVPTFDVEGELDPNREQHTINPQEIVSGTTGKKIGTHSEELMPGVDPVRANIGLIPEGKPSVPDLEVLGQEIPESVPPAGGDSVPEVPKPKKGYVQVECISDKKPFYEGGEMQKGGVYNVSEDEAEILIANGDAKRYGGASDTNAREEGSDA